MGKIILNETTGEWVKSLDPLEYTDAEVNAMEFEDEEADKAAKELSLREHPQGPEPHTPHTQRPNDR